MTTTTLRPVSDDATFGSITKTPNVAAWQNVDDSPADDGTHVASSTYGGAVFFGLQDIALSAGQRVKRVKMRCRAQHNSTDVGHADYADFRLRDPSTGRESTPARLGTFSNSAVPLETGWYNADPGGKAWSEAVVDRMQCTVAWVARATTPPLPQFQMTELYVDVDIRNQLVVSGVTVTGATSTTRPTASWTVTADPDGDAQIRWQVKAFTSAQYGASNFNPDTSAAAWDSGVQTGSATTAVTGKDLLNGTTYKWYVRVAKSWSGPAGSLWWSDWTASAATVLNLTPPPTPSIAVTSETAIPSYRNRIVATLTGLNVLDADTAGFDSTAGFWIAGANTNAPAQSTTNPKSSLGDLLLTATGAGTIEAFSGSFATSRRVRPGQVVSATASFRPVSTQRNWQVGIRFYDAAGGVISTTMGTAVAEITNTYQTAVLLNQTAPANVYSAVLRILSAAAAAAEQHRVDEAGLIIGPTAPWSPGGVGQSGQVQITRAQRISKGIGRGPARNWLHPQIHSSGGLVGAPDGFYARQANDEVRTLPLDRAYPGNPGDASAHMIEWTVRVGAFSYLDVGLPSGVTSDGQDIYAFPAVPGKQMTYGVWAWTDTPGKQIHLNLVYVDNTNSTVLGSTRVGPFTLTAVEQLCTITATPPAGTVWARVETENTGGAGAVNWRYYQVGAHFRPSSEPAEVWPGQTWAFEWDSFTGATVDVDEVTWSATVYDHEAPPGRPVLYRAQLLTTLANGDLSASLPSTPVHVYMDPPSVPLLKDPAQPENAVQVFRYPDSIARTEDAVVLHGMGDDGNPVKVRTWWGGDDGQLQFETIGALEFYRLRQLLRSMPLLLQHHDGGQTYLIANPAAVEELSPVAFDHAVTVPYLEIADPY